MHPSRWVLLLLCACAPPAPPAPGPCGGEALVALYPDLDDDGWGDAEAEPTMACEPRTRLVAITGDCDDRRKDVAPDAIEVCDERDNDCDGATDEDVLRTYFRDADNDGHGDPRTPATLACALPLLHATVDDDCDDADPAAFPGNPEVCDGIDNDCAGGVDDGVTLPFFPDDDGDGHGAIGSTAVQACTAPAHFAALADDCDDTEARSFPGLAETCDGVDNDCNGSVDDGVTTPFWPDLDGDGHGDGTQPAVDACTVPAQHSALSGDCDDADATAFPGNPEACDGVDNDCVGGIDDGVTTAWWPDGDGDGFGDAGASADERCDDPTGAFTRDGGDCDDADPTVFPGAAVTACGPLDPDCDGDPDNLHVPATFTTVADAIDAATNGDMLCLDAGSYVGPHRFGGLSLTVQGAGRGLTELTTTGTSRVLDISTSSAVTLRDLAIRGARSNTQGAGIMAAQTGALTLERVDVDDNVATVASNGDGGGVHMTFGTLTMRDVTFTGNRIVTSGSRHASGGGLFRLFGVTIADDVVFDGNEAISATGTAEGGAWQDRTGFVTATDLLFTGNTTRSRLQPRGSALNVYQSSSTFTRVEVVGNTSEATHDSAGGAVSILSTSQVTLRNCLIADNTTTSPMSALGGALYLSGGQTTLANCTVADNEISAGNTVYGAAVHTFPGSHLVARNTIVADTLVTAPTTWGHVRNYQSTLDATWSAFAPDDFYGMTSPVGADGNVATGVQFQPGTWRLAAGSALIDGGDPSILDVDGSRSDVGYEGGPDAW